MRRAPAFAVFLLLTLTAANIAARAQTLTTLYNFCSQGFTCQDGFFPYGGLVQGSDGNFYGTTECGGSNPGTSGYCNDGLGEGTLFKISPAGTLTTLYDFCAQPGCSDGFFPTVSLMIGSDGNLYGTTNIGGSAECSINGCGTIFKTTASGALTTIHRFGSSPDGMGPQSPLIQGKDGSFYGTTVEGGVNSSACGEPNPNGGCGTVFKIALDGTLTTLYSFCSLTNCADGVEPTQAPLVQGSDGIFYGTTPGGGTNKGGTVFKITSSGTLTTLYSFCAQSACEDGEMPLAGLVQGSDGNFYGTTYCGGTSTATTPACGGLGAGTVFKITPAGVLTTLYSFCVQSGCTDGEYPTAGLVLDRDGNFYGTTEWGGVYGGGPAGNMGGTIFRISPSGTLNTLYSFCAQSSCMDGRYPVAPLVQGEDGNLYGIAFRGGTQDAGTVFRFSLVSGVATASLSPSSLGFGDQVEGTASASKFVTITNTGTANLIFATGAVTFSGTDDQNFMLASDGCSGQTVRPDGTCTVSVTFNPSIVGSESATLNFADNAPNSPQTVSLTGNGIAPDFSLGVASGSSSSATVSPGGRASYSLALAPVGEFHQAVSVSCSGAPTEASCLVSPTAVTLNGSSTSTITVTLSTTAPSGLGFPYFNNPSGPLGCITCPFLFGWLLLTVLVWLGASRFGEVRIGGTSCPAARFRRLALAGVLLAASAFAACGGGGDSGPPSNPGSPAGTYLLTVTGTSGNLSHSITLTLTVN